MKKLIWGLFVLVLLSNCRQDQPQPKSISDILLENEELGMLRSAISYAGLQDAFKTSTVTLFAPTDEGFKAAGFADVSAITALSPEQVRLLLQNHIITKKVTTQDMQEGVLYPTSMMSGARLFLSYLNGVPYLNEAKTTKVDLAATNGVVHIINKAIPVPNRSLAQILKNTPDYSLFRAAATRAVVADPRLAVFTDTTIREAAEKAYTIFLPTNQAMTTGKFSQTEIAATSPVVLARLVSYHIALSRYFSAFIGNSNVQMFDASYITSLKSTPTGITIANPNTPAITPSKLTKTDIIATNGLIHQIDKVLIP